MNGNVHKISRLNRGVISDTFFHRGSNSIGGSLSQHMHADMPIVLINSQQNIAANGRWHQIRITASQIPCQGLPARRIDCWARRHRMQNQLKRIFCVYPGLLKLKRPAECLLRSVRDSTQCASGKQKMPFLCRTTRSPSLLCGAMARFVLVWVQVRTSGKRQKTILSVRLCRLIAIAIKTRETKT